MTDLATFRAETRAWLEANCPPAMRTRMPEEEQVAGGKRAVYVRPEQKIWLDRMAGKCWTDPPRPPHPLRRRRPGRRGGHGPGRGNAGSRLPRPPPRHGPLHAWPRPAG